LPHSVFGVVTYIHLISKKQLLLYIQSGFRNSPMIINMCTTPTALHWQWNKDAAISMLSAGHFT